ncbi:MAG: sugar ABC transporter permease [Clostridia bacterium]|nr:sugar ABC transporter permease [Clostridia bacterium]MBQ8974009.1 sugar ABC transporter permease [Clostridia bacterium]
MSAKQKNNLWGWLFVLPSFAVLLVFIAFPIVRSFYLSLTDYNVLKPPSFVGFKNYVSAFKDPFVQASFRNTFQYVLTTVPIQTILSMIVAAIIAMRFQNRYGRFVKGCMFIPVISSSVLVGTLFTLLFDSTKGVVNSAISLVGIAPVNWLGQKSTALLTVCIATIWKNVGYFLVIFYAGIMDIPMSYYEAAEVDGASKLQQFFSITLPCLKPITYLVVTLGIIWSFQAFDMVYAMTQGGPGKSTYTMVYTIYNAAFREYRMGYACTVALVLFVFILVVNNIQKLFLGRE